MKEINLGVGIVDTCPVLDYDFKDLEKIKKDIRKLRDIFGLDESAIFSTMKGFRVIFIFNCLEKAECLDVVNESAYVDEKYKLMMNSLEDISCRLAGKYDPPDMYFVEFYPIIKGGNLLKKLENKLGDELYLNNGAIKILLMDRMTKMEIHLDEEE